MALHPRQTITAELRRWRRRDNRVEGYIYGDIHEVWEDGERGSLGPIVDVVESVNWYLFVTNTEVYKAPKEEELPDEE